MISIITVVDIITDIMTIMIVGTYGATLDGTAYPAPFVGPSEPPWPFRSSSLRPELPASKQPGSEALRPQPPRDVMGFTRRHRKAKKSRTSPYLNKKVPLTHEGLAARPCHRPHARRRHATTTSMGLRETLLHDSLPEVRTAPCAEGAAVRGAGPPRGAEADRQVAPAPGQGVGAVRLLLGLRGDEAC